MGEKIVLFGAGLIGKKALAYFGSRNVKCFADNSKANSFFCGKTVISFDELLTLKDDYQVVLTVSVPNLPAVTEQCRTHGIRHCVFYDIIGLEDFESNPGLTKYKDMYKGKNGFVLGNGPSLRMSDLGTLHENNAVCLACNRIFKVFNKTEWRPDIFFMSDDRMISLDLDVVANLSEVKHKLIVNLLNDSDKERLERDSEKSVDFYEMIVRRFSVDSPPDFSPDPSRAVFAGTTVVYSMLQWAVYMGFSNIYVMGIDGSYSSTVATEVSSGDYFFEGYISRDEAARFRKPHDLSAATVSMNTAYTSAQSYSKGKNFKIWNATRGGVITAFERVDFDSLF